jgi:Mg/Co/Ni transporter MgtE
MTGEKFAEIVNKISAGEGLSNEEATELVQSMAELDQRGMVAEEIIEFVLHGAEETYRQVIDEVLRSLDLRDKAKVKKIISVGPKAAARLVAATQVYIAQRYYAMQSDESAVSDSDPDILLNEDPA